MAGPDQCEICAAPAAPWVLPGGAALSRCSECGHLGRELSRAPADHRDAAYGGEPTLDRIRLALTYRALRAALPVPATRVFEVGYGSGALLRRFLDAGAQVAGCDPDQLGVGVDPVVREHGHLLASSVEQVDPAQIEADLVFGVHVLEHVLDPVQTLRTSHDLARPGGSVQFLTPAGDSLGLRAYGQAWWMLEDPTHVRFFTARSLTLLAQQCGLEQIQVHRLVLDSLSTDVASLARRWSAQPNPRGVLASPGVLAAAALSSPLVAAARLALPPLRPTLLLTARRAQ